MNRKQILAAFLGAAVLLSLSGCGTSDKVASITLTQPSSSSAGGFFNVQGIGGTLQLAVVANYTSGKTVDETNWATYTVTPEGQDVNTGAALPAPPQGITLSPTGMITAVDPGVCSWEAVSSGGTGTTASYFLVGDYKITATYKGITSQPVYVGVASAADGNNTANGDQCGPS